METGLFNDILQKLERSNENQKNTIQNLMSNENLSDIERSKLNDIKNKNEEVQKALKDKDFNKLQKLMENVNSIIK